MSRGKKRASRGCNQSIPLHEREISTAIALDRRMRRRDVYESELIEYDAKDVQCVCAWE